MIDCFTFLRDVPQDAFALRDDEVEEWVTYGELRDRSFQWSDRLRGPRGLVFQYINNDVNNVAALLGAIAAGHAVALFDPKLGHLSRERLELIYQPDWIVDIGSGTPCRGPINDHPTQIYADLALLLSTSGSTGSPKLVRLTISALEANASGIADVLAISAEDVAAGHLPLHYSYGLSVLMSHLFKGASVRLTDRGLMDRTFWPAMRESFVTHFPGVPFHFQIMQKLGYERIGLKSLRTLTQAGGSLDTSARREAHKFMSSQNGSFYVLYGQTEAAPRMTTLQHDQFDQAESSVGTALPGCRIEIRDPDQNGEGEVIFFGPNVMLGYAEGRSDLMLGDMLHGRLETGDIGKLDAKDRLALTGRVKRVGKIYGLRVNLDEVEREARSIRDSAVLQIGDSIRIYMLTSGKPETDAAIERQLIDHFMQRFALPRSAYRPKLVTSIPRTVRGKVDYAALERLG